MSDDSETVEDTNSGSLTEVADDSCRVEFIEIVPLDTASDDYYTLGLIRPIVVLKPEDLDLKVEPAEENEYPNYVIKQELSEPEVSSSMETTVSDINIPVEMTRCHMQPVIVPETLNLSRITDEDSVHLSTADVMDDWKLRTTPVVRLERSSETFLSQLADGNTQSNDDESSFEVKTEAEAVSNDITEHPLDDRPSPCVHIGKKWYSCDQCGTLFRKQKNLRAHTYVHSQHKCTECGKCLQGEHALRQHRRTHSEQQPFECSICGVRFTTLGLFVDHGRIHTRSNPYKCSMCEKVFTALGLLNAHMNIHTGGKGSVSETASEVKNVTDANDNAHHSLDDMPRPYLCTLCGKRFMTKRQFIIHKRAKCFSCRRCGKLFKNRNTFKCHMNVHSSKYKCHECGKCFHHQQVSTIHKRSHSGQKLFECTVCSKRFTTLGVLAVHSRMQSRMKAYKCNMCDESFAESGQLNAHIRVHAAGKPYKCSLSKTSYELNSLSGSSDNTKRSPTPFLRTVCGKRYTMKAGWLTQKTAKCFSCHQCGKLFRDRSTFTSHMDLHSTKYKCSECGKCLLHKQALTRHMQSHSGQKPFECRPTVCSSGSSSSRSGHRERHSRWNNYEEKISMPRKRNDSDSSSSRSGHRERHSLWNKYEEKISKARKRNDSDSSSSRSGHRERHSRWNNYEEKISKARKRNDSDSSSSRSGHRVRHSRWNNYEEKISMPRKRNDNDSISSRSAHLDKRRQMTDKIDKKRDRRITVGSVSYVDGKRVRDKKLPCFVCKVAVNWLARHLERQHSDNFLVAEVMAKSGSERKNGLKRLKNLGAFNHNVDVLKKGRGELVIARRTKGKHAAHSYLPCSKCYGFFYKHDLWRHACPCNQSAVKKNSTDRSNAVESSHMSHVA